LIEGIVPALRPRPPEPREWRVTEDRMSLRINTNVTALNAYINLGKTNDAYSQSINRLSTGLRINSGADDPAGLILSENLKAQIAGIDQATQNNQDAVNYSKTADGALSEVNTLLSDARALAVAAGNAGTLTAAQVQANQSQLNSIVSSISRIASTTNFGGKKLLDGSAGIAAAVTDGSKFASMAFSGSFNGVALTTSAAVTVNVTTAATKGSVAGTKTYAATTSLVAAGTFSINGTTFNTTATDTVDSMMARINAASGQTGVQATWDSSGTVVDLKSVKYGSGGVVNLSDATGGILLTSAGLSTNAGADLVASVTIDTNGTTTGGLATVTFTGGKVGLDAFTLSDNSGNKITVTEAGNATGSNKAGQLAVGSTTFQIGANVGETASLSLGNFAATELGTSVVAGKNLNNIDITSATNAADALKVIDAAISDVSTKRGEIGSFQKNVLQSNIRSLGVAKENLTATESAITDTDIAAEMTNFSKLQILQQAGMSMLSQANTSPQSVLTLIRGG
jgi:flagellin